MENFREGFDPSTVALGENNGFLEKYGIGYARKYKPTPKFRRLT